MIQFFSKKLKNRKGFTLIELIVVIAILGILALIAIPRLSAFREDAQLAKNNTDAAIIYKAAVAAEAAGRVADSALASWTGYTDYLDDASTTETVDITGTVAAGTLTVTVGSGDTKGTYPPTTPEGQ